MSDSHASSLPSEPVSAPVHTNEYKTKKVAEVASTVGICCGIVLFLNGSWPVAFGVAAIAVSTAVICLRMLK